MPDRKLVAVPYQTLVRIFEKDGFSLTRQEGDHKIFTKAGVLRPLVIPTYRAVPVFIIRNLLRTSGMSRERCFVKVTTVWSRSGPVSVCPDATTWSIPG